MAREIISDNLDYLRIFNRQMDKVIESVEHHAEELVPGTIDSSVFASLRGHGGSFDSGGGDTTPKVYICRKSRSGGAPDCAPSPYTLDQLKQGGADCKPSPDGILCF